MENNMRYCRYKSIPALADQIARLWESGELTGSTYTYFPDELQDDEMHILVYEDKGLSLTLCPKPSANPPYRYCEMTVVNCSKSSIAFALQSILDYAKEIMQCKIATIAAPSKDIIYISDGDADGSPVYDMAECPECGREFEDGQADWKSCFCPKCGQKLNWEFKSLYFVSSICRQKNSDAEFQSEALIGLCMEPDCDGVYESEDGAVLSHDSMCSLDEVISLLVETRDDSRNLKVEFTEDMPEAECRIVKEALGNKVTYQTYIRKD